MKYKAKLTKHGNSLYVLIKQHILDVLGLEKGDEVELDIKKRRNY